VVGGSRRRWWDGDHGVDGRHDERHVRHVGRDHGTIDALVIELEGSTEPFRRASVVGEDFVIGLHLRKRTAISSMCSDAPVARAPASKQALTRTRRSLKTFAGLGSGHVASDRPRGDDVGRRAAFERYAVDEVARGQLLAKKSDGDVRDRQRVEGVDAHQGAAAACASLPTYVTSKWSTARQCASSRSKGKGCTIIAVWTSSK